MARLAVAHRHPGRLRNALSSALRGLALVCEAIDRLQPFSQALGIEAVSVADLQLGLGAPEDRSGATDIARGETKPQSEGPASPLLRRRSHR